MTWTVDNHNYEVIVERKNNKHTYIRILPNITILVTTNYFTPDYEINKLLEDNSSRIKSMLLQQQQRQEQKSKTLFLGKEYKVVHAVGLKMSLGEQTIFLNQKDDLDKWYRQQAKNIFKQHLDDQYQNFSEKIPYPKLKIRKMKSRWGVCNTLKKEVTLNLELIKYDCKFLDYVIVHELSHLVYPNHSKLFWNIVEKNLPTYKDIRRQLKKY